METYLYKANDKRLDLKYPPGINSSNGFRMERPNGLALDDPIVVDWSWRGTTEGTTWDMTIIESKSENFPDGDRYMAYHYTFRCDKEVDHTEVRIPPHRLIGSKHWLFVITRFVDKPLEPEPGILDDDDGVRSPYVKVTCTAAKSLDDLVGV